jgi:hypothetical protein
MLWLCLADGIGNTIIDIREAIEASMADTDTAMTAVGRAMSCSPLDRCAPRLEIRHWHWQWFAAFVANSETRTTSGTR